MLNIYHSEIREAACKFLQIIVWYVKASLKHEDILASIYWRRSLLLPATFNSSSRGRILLVITIRASKYYVKR